MTSYFAAHAILPDGPARDVRFDVVDGRFASVTAHTSQGSATALPGVVLPGFANCHSHAFHRALRGRTHADGGTFWTWRRRMYDVAGLLDPDTYLALARAVYAEMALAGITGVGEFHYLHHAPGGASYADPNAMAEALRQGARDAGIRLTLLDACYLTGGLAGDGHLPLDDVQRRFADRDAETWAERVSRLRPDDAFRVGAAIHSVRAVPRAALPTVVVASRGGPLHVHVSEQPAENEAASAYYRRTPTELLADAGALGPATTAVHATHLTPDDVTLLGDARSTVCLCPTTERDLADGIGPAPELVDAGAALSLGSDQHALIDFFDEARALELDERLRSRRRGRFAPAALTVAMTRHDSIGVPDAGRLEAGARADLVAVRLDSVRTAGADPAQVTFAAAAPDVDTVIVDGSVIVAGGVHTLGDVGRMLHNTISEIWSDA
ncbi:MAG: formimidoylglutamate deiminase [Jatrophihabitans sp.]